MLNFNNIKKQIGTLVVLSVVLTGVTAAPSYAHKAKAGRASTQQVADGEKIALMEGTVTVHEPSADSVEETTAIKPPLTLKQIEKYNLDFGGSFGGPGI
jgi:type IV secretory pathway VirB10-like protein